MTTAASEEAAKPKRVRPFFKRSRQGCLVCRKRHKKCDEVFTDGSCQRCKTSGYECQLPTEEPKLELSKSTRSQVKQEVRSASETSFPMSTDSRSQFSPHLPVQDFSQYAAVAESLDPYAPGQTYHSALPESWPVQVPGQQYVTSPIAYMPHQSMSSHHSTSTEGYPRIGSNSMSSSSSTSTYLPKDMMQPLQLPSTEASTPVLGSYPQSELVACDGPLVRFAKRNQWPRQWQMQMPCALEDLEGWQDLDNLFYQYYRSWLPRSNLHSVSTLWGCPAETEAEIYIRILLLAALQERMKFSRAEDRTPSARELSGSISEAREILRSAKIPSIYRKVIAAMELRSYAFLQRDAATSYKVLAFTEELLDQHEINRQVTGDPLFYAPQNFGVLHLVYADLGRCLVSVNRRPAFSFPPISLVSTFPDSQSYSTASEAHCMPPFAALLLGRILECATAERFGDISSTVRDIEQQIATFNCRDIVDQLWKITLNIVLYTRLLNVGSLNRTIRASTVAILKMLDPVPSSKRFFLPLFLAGVNAVTEEERLAIRHRWPRAPEVCIEEGMDALVMIWNEIDERGNTVNWRRLLEREGRTVTFF